MTLKIDAKFEEKLFQKWQEFGETWPEPLQVSKTCIFIWFYCAKYLMFDLKKYGGVIFHNTEGWCKIWRKTDLWFGKWHEEYRKFSPEQLRVSKLGCWWDPLIQSRKSMSSKFTEKLCVMTIKNGIGNDLSFQNWHEKFDEFWPEQLKVLKILILTCFFWAKYILLELKNTEELSFMKL